MVAGLDAGLDQWLPALTEPGPSGVGVTGPVAGGGWSPRDYAAALAGVDRALHRLAAVRLTLIAAADQAGIAAATGASDTTAWVAATTRTAGPTAARDTRLAATLTRGLPATAAALAAGDLSPDHAGVIAAAATHWPATLTGPQRALVEAGLVAAAARLDPPRLRAAARRALAALPVPEPVVDAHENTILAGEEERAARAARLTWHDNQDGTISGQFTIPLLAGTILAKILHQMTSPRRTPGTPSPTRPSSATGSSSPAQALARATATPTPARDPARGSQSRAVAGVAATGATGLAVPGAAGRGLTGPGSDHPASGPPAHTPTAGRDHLDAGRDHLDWAHRYGLAFTHLLEHLPTDHLHPKTAATIVITLPLTDLHARLRAATLDTGDHISAGTARRLACTAGLIPAVLGGPSLPLDLGRRTRLFTDTHRIALATRYTSCAATGCDRPYAWTELHHRDPWSHGGPTNLDHAVPLCRAHHTQLHTGTLQHTLTQDPTGRYTLTFHPRP